MAEVAKSKAGSGERCAPAEAEAVPGCDAGPAGRAGFVFREIHAALSRRRARKSASAGSFVRDGKGQLS